MLENPHFSKGRYFRHTFQAPMTSLLRIRSKVFQERKQRTGTQPLERGLTSPIDNHISHVEKEGLTQRRGMENEVRKVTAKIHGKHSKPYLE